MALRCPDCKETIVARDRPTCEGCGRVFEIQGRQLDLLPRGARVLRSAPIGAKFHGNRGQLRGPIGWLYAATYVHPIRFIGDRQRTHGKNAHVRLVEFAGDESQRVLDVGSGDRRILSHVVTADIAFGQNIDLRLDAQSLPFPDDSWDRIIVQHVLEHVENPERLIEEVVRTLAPGGRVFAEVPFIFPVHEGQDFRRWTLKGLEQELRALDIVDRGVTIGPFAALNATIRSTVTHRISNPYLATATDIVIGWLLVPITALDAFLAPIEESQIGAGAIYVVGQKRG